MAYIECPSCGHSAPGKATRCPECSLIFTPGIRQQSIARPGLRKLRRGLLVVAAVLVVALAVVTFQGRDRSGAVTVPRVATGLDPEPIVDDTAGPIPVEEEQPVVASPPAPTRPTPTPPPQRDTAPPVNRALPIESPPDTVTPVAAGDNAPRFAEAPPLDTTPAIEVPPDTVTEVVVGDSAPAAVAPAAGPLQRYARTWVSIREGPSDSALVVRTLAPGEAVLVDSLSQGWYRVVVDGRTVGYVDQAYLDVEAP